MEGVKTFWLVNSVYSDVKEFHFASDDAVFVVYFKDDKPIFVLDNTCDIVSPNNLLLIEPLPEDFGKKNPDTKWDAILKNKFNVDPIKVRPKENTKYKKLDISYTSLSDYDEFSKNQTDDLLSKILQKKEALSLENAYDREAENLLQYNKSTQTIEKASVTLENLKKKILNISKRLKRQKEAEEKNPEKIDEELKQELVKKLYDNTEKLKRTERRIKRAKKRAEASFEDLSLKRVQIQEIKNRMASKSVKIEPENAEVFTSHENEPQRILEKYNVEDSQPIINNKDEKTLQNQDVDDRKIEELTTEKLNDKNVTGDILRTEMSAKENNIMVKDTEKNIKNTTEFKPPFVDDTANENTNTNSDIRFAKKTSAIDDKYKKVWMYVASILVSLVIVFGLFFFLSGSDEGQDKNNFNSNYVEQNYVEEAVEETPAPIADDEPSVSEPVVEETPIEPNVETPVDDEPYYEEEVEEEVVVAPKPAPVITKPTLKKAVVATSKKSTPKPAPKKTAVKPQVVANVPEESDDDYQEEKKLSTFDLVKKEYVDNVLAGDEYITLLNDLKNSFFTMEDDEKIAQLETMNHYWNNFRNAVYDAYYENDYTLKSGINYEEYANDEYLLRIYTNAYNDFFEYIVNEFVMTYEYADGTATDLYQSIEDELQVLGKPLAKLELLAKVYNAVQAQGGPSAVLSAIAKKDENEEPVDNAEIEAELLPVVYGYSEETTVYYVDEDSSEPTTTPTAIISEEEDFVSSDADDDYDEDMEDVEYTTNVEDETVIGNNDDEDSSFTSDDENTETVVAPLSAETEEVVYEEDATDEPEQLEVVIEDDEEVASMPENEESEEIIDDDVEYADEDEADDEYYDDDDMELSDSDDDYYEESVL